MGPAGDGTFLDEANTLAQEAGGFLFVNEAVEVFFRRVCTRLTSTLRLSALNRPGLAGDC